MKEVRVGGESDGRCVRSHSCLATRCRLNTGVESVSSFCPCLPMAALLSGLSLRGSLLAVSSRVNSNTESQTALFK